MKKNLFILFAASMIVIGLVGCKDKDAAIQGCVCEVNDLGTGQVTTQEVSLQEMQANEVNDCAGLVNKAKTIWGEGIEVECKSK